MNKKLLIASVFILIYQSLSYAQTNYLMNSNTAVTVTCPATNTYFYDDGNSGANYTASKNYTKTFTSSNGQSLEFNFTSFATQQGNDILTIYDGPDNTYPVIGQYSGVISPGVVISSSSSITFNWKSNANTNKAGWAATITCVNAPPSYNMANGTVSVCDALFYDNGGVGGNYSDNQNITETFTSNNGNCMRATFYGFTVQAGDLLNIYDGPTTSSPLIGSFSGTTVPFKSLLGSSGSLTFNFTSNNTLNGGGWSVVLSCDQCPPPAPSGSNATYTMYATGQSGTYLGGNMVNTCGGTVADNGDLAGNYTSNINDVYRVFCPNSAQNCVRISFFSADIIGTGDYLDIGSGATQNDANKPPPTNPNFIYRVSSSCTNYADCIGKGIGPFTSFDQSGCLVLRFNSNGSSNGAGFAAVLDCVPCSFGPTGTSNADCQYATPICSNSSFDDASTGPGLVSEAGSACTMSENYSNWYSITVSSSGTLGLTIDPNTNSDDYDFALYGPNVGCGSLGTPSRCSYAAVSGTGNTGIGNSATDLSEGASGNGWVKLIDVVAGETYYLLVSKWDGGGDGFSLNWTLTNGASLECPILPVTLTSFTCSTQNGSIMLDWKTQSEFNSDHFLIEKSSDGENFSSLTIVPAKGSTTSPTEYFVVDNKPYTGDTYYRLNEVDKNGDVIHLQTTVCSSSDPNENITLQVYDLEGRLLRSQVILISEYETTMRNSGLPNGVYVTALVHSNGTADLSKYLKMY